MKYSLMKFKNKKIRNESFILYIKNYFNLLFLSINLSII